MMEEINEVNITKLLESLPHDLNATERTIMSLEGTVQTFLSVLCNTPVKVEVISQYEIADVIIRWSKLVAVYGDEQVVVCLAESIIPISDIGILNCPDFITMVNDKKKGIGQIIKEIGFKTTRHIKGFHSDEKTFARTYTIDGEICMIITEVFNRETIAKVSSTRVKSRCVSGNGCVVDPINLDELSGLLGDLRCETQQNTTDNTKVDEVVASEQPIDIVGDGDSE